MAELAAFIRDHAAEILAEWKQRVLAIPDADGTPEPVLENNMPQIIEQLAVCARNDECRSDLSALPSVHALDRYKIGFDIRTVVSEYRILRSVIFGMYPGPEDGLIVHDALDRAIADAVDYFALERDRAREMFTAILGHDLRNPLNAITMAAQHLLAQDGIGERPRRLAARIAASTGRIERMVGDLLDITRSRIGTGLPIALKPVDPHALLRDVVEEFNEGFPDRDVRVEEARGDVAGEWDPDRLAQLISNLVANALEHGADPITVRTIDRGDAVAFEVHNRGTFDVGTTSRVFDPFVSLAPAHEGRRGLGLGLYIVREIARAHGGQITVESSEATGTTFRVILPRAPRPSADAASRGEHPA